MPFLTRCTSPPALSSLSLHDALPISLLHALLALDPDRGRRHPGLRHLHVRDDARARLQDRKSTRLNSSHTVISYAVFCLKKKMRGLPDVTDRTGERHQAGPLASMTYA